MDTSVLTFLLNACLAVLLIGIERIWPNQSYEWDWSWTIRAVLLAGAGISLTLVLGSFIQANLNDTNSHFNLLFRANWLTTHLNEFVQGIVGYYCVTFFVYWWHRLRHYSDTVWRWFHQIHHSTYRLETVTAFYAHPSDFLSNALIVNAVSYFLLGYNLEAALWTTFWVGVFELWEHTNIKTPKWIGYFIVRPEMHRVHHEKNKHSNNYGIPLWDIVFGTYENSTRTVECGFERINEKKIWSMLFFRSVE
jgi:sterol desaturase/sphingolipid hydroxylase (fatty acid hydroxylase superfamily)